jgi:hypothetical protein
VATTDLRRPRVCYPSPAGIEREPGAAFLEAHNCLRGRAKSPTTPSFGGVLFYAILTYGSTLLLSVIGTAVRPLKMQPFLIKTALAAVVSVFLVGSTPKSNTQAFIPVNDHNYTPSSTVSVCPIWASLEQAKHKDKIAKLISCESGGRNGCWPDSDGINSCGILQFHEDGTWQEMSYKSGIVGTSSDPNDAIRMADWMIDNGYLRRWTCAKIEHLL